MSSSRPSAFIKWLPGIQIYPPDVAVVPPKTGAFSVSRTSSPAFFAVIAAAKPAAPEPITKTSHSCLCVDTVVSFVVASLTCGGLACGRRSIGEAGQHDVRGAFNEGLINRPMADQKPIEHRPV